MNPIEIARNFFAKLFPARTWESGTPNRPQKTGPGYDQPMQQPGSNGDPNRQNIAVSSPPPSPIANARELEQKIRAGFVGQVGEVPALQYIPEFVQAAQQYPIFQQNPYLMPQVAILETTGGKHITRPNNLINYGIRDPKINEIFKQVGIREALQRSLKEIGETGNTYARFRTGKPLSESELQDFARTYEPMNDSYYDNLVKGIQFFEKQ